jgi:hypothetical protein
LLGIYQDRVRPREPSAVYIETRQGFEVDGVEIKARLDFAAAAIDYRGLQKNTAA